MYVHILMYAKNYVFLSIQSMKDLTKGEIGNEYVAKVSRELHEHREVCVCVCMCVSVCVCMCVCVCV